MACGLCHIYNLEVLIKFNVKKKRVLIRFTQVSILFFKVSPILLIRVHLLFQELAGIIKLSAFSSFSLFECHKVVTGSKSPDPGNGTSLLPPGWLSIFAFSELFL